MKDANSTASSVDNEKPLISEREEDSIYASLKNLSPTFWTSENTNSQSPEHHLKLSIKYTIEAHRLFRKNKRFFEGDGICLPSLCLQGIV